MRKFFRDCNLVIRNYRDNTLTVAIAAVFAIQCLISSLAIVVGVHVPVTFLSVTSVVLGLLGVAFTLYVHRPNSDRPDTWGVVFPRESQSGWGGFPFVPGRFPGLFLLGRNAILTKSVHPALNLNVSPNPRTNTLRAQLPKRLKPFAPYGVKHLKTTSA
jgi:hypothetical protein